MSIPPRCDPWCWYIKPYKTVWFWTRANVGIHIPAPWSIWAISLNHLSLTFPVTVSLPAGIYPWCPSDFSPPYLEVNTGRCQSYIIWSYPDICYCHNIKIHYGHIYIVLHDMVVSSFPISRQHNRLYLHNIFVQIYIPSGHLT